MLLTPACQGPWMLFVFYYLTSLQLWTLLESLPLFGATVPLAALPSLASAPVREALDTLGACHLSALGRERGLCSEKQGAVLGTP